MADELRGGVSADAALRAGDGGEGVGKGGVLFERGGVYGGCGGAALCVRGGFLYVLFSVAFGSVVFICFIVSIYLSISSVHFRKETSSMLGTD